MTHSNRYFIEYRLCGKLRLELLSIQKELSEEFSDFSEFDEQIPHITLIPPINGDIPKEFILESIREELKPVRLLEFKVKNYDFFDNEDKKPIFVNIKFDKEFGLIRERLVERLRRKVEIVDKFEDEGYNPHIALGFTEKKRNAQEIVKFLNKKHTIDMRQVFDRITILNGNRILWEYDIFNKKALVRPEALKHRQRLDTIQDIIEFKNKGKVVNKKAVNTSETPLEFEGSQPFDEQADRTGTRWENREKEQLIQEFESGILIPELAIIHKRNEDAIFYKLSDLGLLNIYEAGGSQIERGTSHTSHRRNKSPLLDAQDRLGRFIDYNKDRYDDRTFIHNLRGEIVHISHDVYKSHGTKGHRVRQKVRRILWDYSKRKFKEDNSHINLDEYRPPHESDGIIKNIIKNIINKFFKK